MRPAGTSTKNLTDEMRVYDFRQFWNGTDYVVCIGFGDGSLTVKLFEMVYNSHLPLPGMYFFEGLPSKNDWVLERVQDMKVAYDFLSEMGIWINNDWSRWRPKTTEEKIEELLRGKEKETEDRGSKPN